MGRGLQALETLSHGSTFHLLFRSDRLLTVSGSIQKPRTRFPMLFFVLCPLLVLSLSSCMPNPIDVAKPHHRSELSMRFDKSIHKENPYSVVPVQKHARCLTRNDYCLSSSMLHPRNREEDHSQPRYSALEKHKRMFRFSLENQLQLRRMDVFNTLVPIEVTAAVLEDFYSQILRQVEADWSLSPPLNPLVLTYGPFELSLAMRGGEIPWIMVANLVQSMLELARAQLTPTYHLYWETLDQTVSLSVLLRLLPERLLGSP